jgi:hypothetical protein
MVDMGDLLRLWSRTAKRRDSGFDQCASAGGACTSQAGKHIMIFAGTG